MTRALATKLAPQCIWVSVAVTISCFKESLLFRRTRVNLEKQHCLTSGSGDLASMSKDERDEGRCLTSASGLSICVGTYNNFSVCRFLSLVLRLLSREVLMNQHWAKLNLLRRFVRVTRPVMMETSTQLLFCTMKPWQLTLRTAFCIATDLQPTWKPSSTTRRWMMQSKPGSSTPNGQR